MPGECPDGYEIIRRTSARIFYKKKKEQKDSCVEIARWTILETVKGAVLVQAEGKRHDFRFCLENSHGPPRFLKLSIAPRTFYSLGSGAVDERAGGMWRADICAVDDDHVQLRRGLGPPGNPM